MVKRTLLLEAVPKDGTPQSCKVSTDDIWASLGSSKSKQANPEAHTALTQAIRDIVGNIQSRTARLDYPSRYKPYPIYSDQNIYFLVDSRATEVAWESGLPGQAKIAILQFLDHNNSAERDLCKSLRKQATVSDDETHDTQDSVMTSAEMHWQRIRSTLISRSPQILSQHFDPDVYVPRGSADPFARFLAATDSLAFPIFGPAGIGKTYEMCALTANLLSTVVPVIVPARFLKTPFAKSVARAMKLDFQNCGLLTRHVSPSEDIDLPLPQGWTLVVFLDGLNEYHLSEQNELFLADELVELFTWAQGKKIKIVLSCRTYTWRSALTHDYLLRYMYKSHTHETDKGDYDWRTEEEPWRRDANKETSIQYGCELDPYSHSECTEFWNCIKRKHKLRSVPDLDFLLTIDDPFLCARAAESVAEKRKDHLNIDTLISTYIDHLCHDRGPVNRQQQTRLALMKIASCFLTKKSEVPEVCSIHLTSEFFNDIDIRTLIPWEMACETIGKANLDRLIHIGLLVDRITPRNMSSAVTFRNDRVMENVICDYLYNIFVKDLDSIQEKAYAVFHFLKCASSLQKHQDYLLSIGRLMAGRIADRSIESRFSAGEAFFLLQTKLSEDIPISLCKSLFALLEDAVFGFQVALALRDHSKKADNLRSEIDAFLQNLPRSYRQPRILENSITFAPAASPKVALEFLMSMTETVDSNVRLRIVHAFEELEREEAIPILQHWQREAKVADSKIRKACESAIRAISVGQKARQSARKSTDKRARKGSLRMKAASRDER